MTDTKQNTRMPVPASGSQKEPLKLEHVALGALDKDKAAAQLD